MAKKAKPIPFTNPIHIWSHILFPGCACPESYSGQTFNQKPPVMVFLLSAYLIVSVTRGAIEHGMRQALPRIEDVEIVCRILIGPCHEAQ